MLILNLKNYPQVSYPDGKKYFEAANKVIEKNPSLKDAIYFAPPVVDMLSYKREYPNLNFISQHTDLSTYGSTTGWVSYERLLDEGINYTLLNHSEHRFSDRSKLFEHITKLQEAGIKIVVCGENVAELNEVLTYKPYAVAYEPPELIGTGYSVTNRPEEVKEFIETIGDKSLAFIGAGVATGEDVSNSLTLGAKGVLLASAFVKADDIDAKLEELTKSFLN